MSELTTDGCSSVMYRAPTISVSGSNKVVSQGLTRNPEKIPTTNIQIHLRVVHVCHMPWKQAFFEL